MIVLEDNDVSSRSSSRRSSIQSYLKGDLPRNVGVSIRDKYREVSFAEAPKLSYFSPYIKTNFEIFFKQQQAKRIRKVQRTQLDTDKAMVKLAIDKAESIVKEGIPLILKPRRAQHSLSAQESKELHLKILLQDETSVTKLKQQLIKNRQEKKNKEEHYKQRVEDMSYLKVFADKTSKLSSECSANVSFLAREQIINEFEFRIKPTKKEQNRRRLTSLQSTPKSSLTSSECYLSPRMFTGGECFSEEKTSQEIVTSPSRNKPVRNLSLNPNELKKNSNLQLLFAKKSASEKSETFKFDFRIVKPTKTIRLGSNPVSTNHSSFQTPIRSFHGRDRMTTDHTYRSVQENILDGKIAVPNISYLSPTNHARKNNYDFSYNARSDNKNSPRDSGATSNNTRGINRAGSTSLHVPLDNSPCIDQQFARNSSVQHQSLMYTAKTLKRKFGIISTSTPTSK